MPTRLPSFRAPVTALIQGASRGIGLGFARKLLHDERVEAVFATSRAPDQSEGLEALAAAHPGRLHRVAMDVTDEGSIAAAADAVGAKTRALHLVINATGVLHDAARGMQPEKALRDLDPAHLAHAFAVNATGPLLVAKHFWRLLRHEDRAVLANLSARVGSIGDNHLGGWYGYRASKAAQNQFTRTLSIELGRRAPNLVCVALHPGTVATDLSAPFRGNVSAATLQTVDECVDHLLAVIDDLSPEDSGRFFDWAGQAIEW